jgi:hypothetical protein
MIIKCKPKDRTNIYQWYRHRPAVTLIFSGFEDISWRHVDDRTAADHWSKTPAQGKKIELPREYENLTSVYNLTCNVTLSPKPQINLEVWPEDFEQALVILAYTRRNLRKAKIFQLVEKTAKVWLLW